MWGHREPRVRGGTPKAARSATDSPRKQPEFDDANGGRRASIRALKAAVRLRLSCSINKDGGGQLLKTLVCYVSEVCRWLVVSEHRSGNPDEAMSSCPCCEEADAKLGCDLLDARTGKHPLQNL